MICLDTNIVIGIVNGRSSSLRHRLVEQMRSCMPVALPAIALFEMRYGFAKSDRRAVNERLLERFLGLGVDVLPFDAEDAAHARRRGATLVTANGREFARVPGLMVTDWVT